MQVEGLVSLEHEVDGTAELVSQDGERLSQQIFDASPDPRRRTIVAILQALVLGAILPPMLHGDFFPAVLGIPIWIMIWRCDSVILNPQEAIQ